MEKAPRQTLSVLALLLAAFAGQGGVRDALSQETEASPQIYRDFEELSQAEVLGKDYQIVVEDRASPISVLAIHGGGIEKGTSEVARAIAGKDFNGYWFEGIKFRGNLKLHITSARFDEPRALSLVRRSKTCISVHGFAEAREERVCIGGLDRMLGSRIAGKLRDSSLGITVELPCLEYPGVEPENIVNRCEHTGVQLELSRALRDRLRKDDLAMKAFAKAVRSAVSP